MGSSLVNHLSKKYRVIAFHRDKKILVNSFKNYRVNLINFKLFKKKFNEIKPDIVIHTAAALPLYKKEEIFTTDVDGTSNLLESAFDAKVKRFIHISSTAVYGIPDHHPLMEEDDLIGVGPYGKAKIKAEKISLLYRDKGMCVSILRPKSFVGPERLGVFALLYDWAKDGHNFPMIGNGSNRYQLLDVEDLCQAIVLCMQLNRDK